MNPPDSPDKLAVIATHDLYDDPGHSFSAFGRRTCRRCGRAVIYRPDGTTYASATEIPCAPGAPRSPFVPKAFAEYQPRWIAFAAANFCTPAEAHLTPIPLWKFMAWIAAEWRAWFKACGRPEPGVYSDADHAGFDAYLAIRYPEIQPTPDPFADQARVDRWIDSWEAIADAAIARRSEGAS